MVFSRQVTFRFWDDKMGSGLSIVAMTDAHGMPSSSEAGGIVATAIAPSERAHEVAGQMSQRHSGVEAHVMPLPSPDIVSTLLRRDLDRVRAALLAPAGSRDQAISVAMEALPRARRLAALLESLVPLLSAAGPAQQGEPKLKKAPEEVVQGFPTHKFQANAYNDGKVECYICLEEYQSGDELRRLPCKHEFHSKCVDRWLLQVASFLRIVNALSDTETLSAAPRSTAPAHAAEKAWSRRKRRRGRSVTRWSSHLGGAFRCCASEAARRRGALRRKAAARTTRARTRTRKRSRLRRWLERGLLLPRPQREQPRMIRCGRQQRSLPTKG